MREGYISPSGWQLFQNLGISRLFSYFHSQTKELQVTLSSWEQPGNVCAQCSAIPLGFLRANRSCASSLDFQGQSQRNLPGRVWDQEEMLPAAHPCAGGFHTHNMSRSKESSNHGRSSRASSGISTSPHQEHISLPLLSAVDSGSLPAALTSLKGNISQA